MAKTEESVYFAGEHTATQRASMNGAIESGLRVTEELKRTMKMKFEAPNNNNNKFKIILNKIFTITALLITSLTMGQSLTLNNMESKLKWTGKEMTTKEHYGSIGFKSGIMTLKDNQPVYGKFIVDMITLKNEDLPEDYRGRLEGHLKSDDFFSVNIVSEAILE